MNADVYRRVLGGEPLTAALSRSLWRLAGPDAERYLNGQVTCDVTKLTEGQAGYAAVCTAKGRMDGDVFIARHGGAFYIDAVGDLHESLGARLDKYLIADDAAFEDLTDSWSLSHIFGKMAPQVPEGGFAVPNARFGVPGFDVWLPSPAGKSEVEGDVLETLRLEHGIPAWGAELTTHTLPPEAGPHMLNAISYTKGCYVGQETIARLKSVGHVNKSLVFLRGETEEFPAVGAKLNLGEREVGTVTSSGFSPRLGKGIALGYAQRAATVDGTVFAVDGLKFTTGPALKGDA
jgi:folate-binding protein YgfZ